MTTTANFYQRLSPLSDFNDVADTKGFVPVPDDWTVMICDVVDSTGAIERGQYKAVNMVGAAAIIAVVNACDRIEIPFMFGGDGGVAIVPPEQLKSATTRLGALRDKCPDLFDLTLRTAAIPVSALRKAGADLQVAKFSLMDNNTLAMFAGGGIDLADEWLKAEDDGPYHLKPEDGGRSLDLEGLSCRWQPLQSLNGVMLTLIVRTTGKGPADANLNSVMNDILGRPVTDFAPVQEDNMQLEKPLSTALSLERKALRSTRGRYLAFVWTLFTRLAQAISASKNMTIGGYNAETYNRELRANTDFRKFDGALRMVIDVTTEQADRIESRLEELHQKDQLVYGTWRSDAALMTCLVFDIAQSLHVHFIDGADGGYTRAAKALKQREAK